MGDMVNLKSKLENSLHELISINPATLEKIGKTKISSKQDVEQAVALAKKTQPQWQKLGFPKRKKYLLKLRDLILENTDSIARLISQENGKPVIEALAHDIIPVLDLITYFAKNAQKFLTKESVMLGKWNFLGRTSYLEFDPVGVVGVISPWNFPFSIPVGEVAMALIVGNTVVLKPSEYTALVGQKIAALFEKAEFPSGVFQVINGPGDVGSALIKARVDKIAFTGSVNTGKKIMAACAENLIPVSLELGGKDPFIVLEDANLDVASSAAVWGAFCNSGQVCASVERVYVHRSIEKEFTQKVLEKTKKLRQGIGLSAQIDVGAMTAEMQIKKVEQQMESAKKQGAKILIGGERLKEENGFFYKPTILTGVDHSFDIIKDETFGPVLPIMTFENDDEAIGFANDSEYALNAYIWSQNKKRAKKMASQIQAGTVNINESVFTHALPQTPWGGPKQSGIGRTHGSIGLLDLVKIRHVHINHLPFKKNFFWWYGYNQDKIDLLKSFSQILFGKGFARVSAVGRFLKSYFKVEVS